MRSSFAVLLLLVVLFSYTNAVGLLTCDEICGYTDESLSIPNLTTTNSFSNKLSVERFHATNPAGFSLNTVGGINLQSESGISLHSDDNLSISSPIGGDLTFRGDAVTLSAGDLMSFWVANEAIIDVKEDINLPIPFGTIDFYSHYQTKLSSVDGMILSATGGDVRIRALEGTAILHADSIGLTAGGDNAQGLSMQSFDSILINADREFDILSFQNLEFNATSAFHIHSRLNNIELEAASELRLQATSNIVSSAADDIYFESLLGDIQFQSEGVISLYSRNMQQKASHDISLISEASFVVDGSGSSNFLSLDDAVLSVGDGVFMALENMYFKGINNADIRFDVNALTHTASDLHIQSANLKDSKIDFSANQLDFISSHSNLHMNSGSTSFAVGDATTLNADNHLFIGSTHENPYVPGAFSGSQGLLGVYASNGLFFDSTASVSLYSLSTLSLDDQSDISITASRNMLSAAHSTVSYIGANVDVAGTSTLSLYTAVTDMQALSTLHLEGADVFALIADNGALDLEVTNTFSVLADTIDFHAFNSFFFSSDSISMLSTDDIRVESSSAAALEANDQTTSLFSKGDFIVNAESTAFGASVLTIHVPSGDASFTAASDIMIQGEETYFASIAGAIDFTNGKTTMEADRVVFRAGNNFSLEGASPVSVQSENVNINSASSIGFDSDSLSLVSDNDVVFAADDLMYVFSDENLDISVNPDMDLVIGTGRTIFDANNQLLIHGDYSASFVTQDHNSFEMNSPILTMDTTTFQTVSSHTNIKVDNAFTLASSNATEIIGSNMEWNSLANFGTSALASSFSSDIDGTLLEAQSILMHTLSDSGTFSMNGADISLTGADISVYGGDDAHFASVGDMTFIGDSMDISLVPSRPTLVSDNTITGAADFLTCGDATGDFRVEHHSISFVTAPLLIEQLVNPCGECTDCAAGGFRIVTHSETLQTISAASHTLLSSNATLFQGGRISMTGVSDVSLTSASSITIASMNGDSKYADTDDDKLYAGNQVVLDATEAISIRSVGYSPLPLSHAVLPGFEMDVHTGPIAFHVPENEFMMSAMRDSIYLSTNNLGSIIMQNTRDLVVDGGVGSIALDAYGITAGGNALSNGFEFLAVQGDISIHSDATNVLFHSSGNALADAKLGSIEWSAGRSIVHVATEHDAELIYNPLQQPLEYHIEENIMLTAGRSFFPADIAITASQDFSVLTLEEQRFLSVGPNTVEGQDSIILVGDEGPILFTTPLDQQIYSSGRTFFEAQTSDLSVTALLDITLQANSEIHFVSQFTVPVSVSAGDIIFEANGGSGSLTFDSDDSQAIIVHAKTDIGFTAKDSTYVNAGNGIDATTNLGDVRFTQGGDHQNTHFHSRGSIVMQALGDEGVQYSARDFTGTAGKDVFFDATEAFTIGSTSVANSGTEPVMTFNGGGEGNAAIVFDVLGGMSWTTNLRGPIRIDSTNAEWTAAGDIILTSNGPILFENSGEFSENSFTMTTQALLTLEGETAEFSSRDELIVNTVEDITLTAVGTNVNDISLLASNNDFVIDTTLLSTTTGLLNGIVDQFYVDVIGEIRMVNTIGNGGSFSYASDSSLTASTLAGPMDFSAAGIMTITSVGADSPIVWKSAANLSLISGDSLVATAGSQIDIDAPHGVTLETLTGNVAFVSSSEISVRANSTFSHSAGDLFVLESGLAIDNGLVSSFNISSRGTLDMTSTEDMQFQVDDIGSQWFILSDQDLTLRNAIASIADQGDIRVESSGTLVMTSGQDSFVEAGGSVTSSFEFSSSIVASHGITYESTNPSASVTLIAEEGDGLQMYSNHEMTLEAMADLTISSDEFTWEQDNEEGILGMRLSSNGVGESMTFESLTNTLSFAAQTHISARSSQYQLFSAVNEISIETIQHGADVKISSVGPDGFNIQSSALRVDASPGIPFMYASGNDADGTSILVESAVSTSMLADTLAFTSNNLRFENPDTAGSTIRYDANGSLGIITSGIDGEGKYGIQMESDDSIQFTASDFMDIRSLGGDVAITAAEDFVITAAEEMNFNSGHDLIISTGYSPQLNAPLADRAGISLFGRSRSSIRSTHHDISISSEDSSWSATTSLAVRTGSSISFDAPSSPLLVSADSLLVQGRDVEFSAAEDISVDAESIFITSRDSMLLSSFTETLFDGISTINVAADHGIVLHTPKGYVDVTNTLFLIPQLIREGGISGHGIVNGDKYRVAEENQYPVCENRAFGFDTESKAFCICQFNKWLCRDAEDIYIYP